MSDDVLDNPLVKAAMREGRRSLGVEEFYGILGDKDGRLSEGLPPNKIRIREVTVDGGYGKDYVVTAWTHQTTNYMMYPGTPVVVGYVNGELAVLGQYALATQALGLNPVVLNPGNPFTQSTPTTEILPLLCHAVGTIATPSTKVGVKSFRYSTPERVVGWYQGSVSTQIDLASYIPPTGEHRYAAIFFNVADQTFTVRASTSKNMIVPLDDADKQECFNQQPPYSIPVAMWRLHNGQTSITQADFVEDLRPLFGHGEARQNYSAASNPTSGDDKEDGYGVGSLWVNTNTNTIWVCVDDTMGAAVWVNVSGSTGMTSWTLSGDEGTPQVITDGNIVNVQGEWYISTNAQNTDTIVIKDTTTPLWLLGW